MCHLRLGICGTKTTHIKRREKYWRLEARKFPVRPIRHGSTDSLLVTLVRLDSSATVFSSLIMMHTVIITDRQVVAGSVINVAVGNLEATSAAAYVWAKRTAAFIAPAFGGGQSARLSLDAVCIGN